MGRVAFKKGSTPWMVATPSHSPHALRPSSFRAPGWGAPALPSTCCGRSATSWRLAPFIHRSASRIFIRQPDCIPPPMVTQDGDHQLDGGRSKPGCGLCSTLSFKDLHHPCWGGGRGDLGPAFAWAGVPLLPPASGGGNHPPALRRRRPSAVPGKANCCCPVQGAAFHPLFGRRWPAAPGGLTTRRTPRGRYSCSGTVPFSFS